MLIVNAWGRCRPAAWVSQQIVPNLVKSSASWRPQESQYDALCPSLSFFTFLCASAPLRQYIPGQYRGPKGTDLTQRRKGAEARGGTQSKKGTECNGVVHIDAQHFGISTCNARTCGRWSGPDILPGTLHDRLCPHNGRRHDRQPAGDHRLHHLSAAVHPGIDRGGILRVNVA